MSCTSIPQALAGAKASDSDKRYLRFTELNGPGFAVLVIKNGKVVKELGFGLADRSQMRANGSATNFNLASNSKQFTAAAALLLEQAGRLSAEDPISKFIPDLPGYLRQIRIKHLIHHTSGLPDYMDLCERSEAVRKKVRNDDVFAFLKTKEKLEFPPGSRMAYSNTGYVLLSEIVQRASGLAFPDFIQKNIFKPLGMRNRKKLGI